MAFRRRLAFSFAASLMPLSVAACGGDDDAGNPSITLDEVGCTYEGDKTPKAPAFMLDTLNQTSSYSFVEVDRIPADVTDDEIEAFFEDGQDALEQGRAFPGLPREWRLIRRAGQGVSTGSMLVGDPTLPDQMLVAGQKYVIWCSTGEPPTAVFLATVFEATE